MKGKLDGFHVKNHWKTILCLLCNNIAGLTLGNCVSHIPGIQYAKSKIWKSGPSQTTAAALAQDGVHFPGNVSLGFARQLLRALCQWAAMDCLVVGQLPNWAARISDAVFVAGLWKKTYPTTPSNKQTSKGAGTFVARHAKPTLTCQKGKQSAEVLRCKLDDIDTWCHLIHPDMAPSFLESFGWHVPHPRLFTSRFLLLPMKSFAAEKHYILYAIANRPWPSQIICLLLRGLFRLRCFLRHLP